MGFFSYLCKRKTHKKHLRWQKNLLESMKKKPLSGRY